MKIVRCEKYGPDPIFDIDSGSGSYQFGVCGTRRGLALFKVLEGGGLDKDKGLFGSNKMCNMASISFFEEGDKFLTVKLI